MPIIVLNLTRYHRSLDAVCPAAYLDCISNYNMVCCSIPLPAHLFLMRSAQEDIVDGLEREDWLGSIAEFSPQVKRTCIAGRQKFHAAQLDHTLRWLYQTPNGMNSLSRSCFQSEICGDIRLHLLVVFASGGSDIPIGLQPWDEWAAQDEFAEAQRMCPSCLEIARVIFEAGRRQVWEMLPSFFALPAWRAK